MSFMYFNNLGYLQHKFSNSELQPIRAEIEEIKKDFTLYDSKKHNSKLAGNIRKEYILEQSHSIIRQLTYPLVMEYENHFNFLKCFDMMTQNFPIELGKCWVNFQKKGEFNPVHSHDGIWSFVIYISVPFNIEEELKHSPGYESNNNCSGHFQFLYTNALGNINQNTIPVDKSFENTILVFPSKLVHTVYPFFTSDDYRISISGNYYFDNSKTL